jgi:hypothetical protein
MSQLKVDTITDEAGTGSPSLPNGLTVGGVNYPSTGPLSNRNLIINGAMQIAQRGTSLSLSNSSEYLLDRFRTFKSHTATATVTQSSDAPAGFNNSWLITVGTGATTGASDELQVAQPIEGFNAAQLNLGTASATSFTLSFWVKSSLTGTFAVAFQSDLAVDTYVATYTIAVVNVWEYKTITVPATTVGTWLKNSGIGLSVVFDLGSGSNQEATPNVWTTGNKVTASGTTKVANTSGATWQITGVQLEAGTVATPFEHRSFGQELALCQRYFCKTYDIDVVPGATSNGSNGSIRVTSISTTSYMTFGNWRFPVSMRSVPSIITYNPRTGVTNGFIGDASDFVGVGASGIGQSGVELRVGGPLSIGTDVFLGVAATASAEL